MLYKNCSNVAFCQDIRPFSFMCLRTNTYDRITLYFDIGSITVFVESKKRAFCNNVFYI